ncbi:hypothetical protein EI613_18755 [Azospirillum sp. 412522]|nr:hypothetical protein [Azospirillum sp. 412522]MBY6263943.1 hypothetical protein [Azospirillum sp. 412522]
MSLSQLVLDAIDRLKQYNLGIYNAVSNRFGLSGVGGMANNWSRHSKDIATACEAVGSLTEASAASQSNAAASAAAAAGSAQSAQQNALATAADRQATGQDRQSTAADRQTVATDKAAAHADRLAADADAAATAADRSAVATDKAAAHADRLAADADAAATAADRSAVATDKAAVHADRLAADAAAAAAQTWDPTNYLRKDAPVDVTGQVKVRGGYEWPYQAFFSSAAAAGVRGHYLTSRSRGTSAAPVAVQNNDSLGGLAVGGYDGNGWTYGWNGGGELTLVASQAWTSTTKGSRWEFSTTQNGTVNPVVRLTITDSGLVAIGAGGKLTIASGDLPVQAPDGNTVVLGGGQTAQYPFQVQVAESAHTTSRRSTLSLGSVWQWISDIAGSGTRDLGLWSNALGAVVLKVLTTGVTTFLRAVLSPPVNLGNVSGAINLDLSLGNTFNMTLVGTVNFATPANLANYVGMYFTLNMAQDGNGNRAAGWASPAFNFAGSTLTLSTGANKIDRVTCFVYSATSIHVISKKGY